METTKPSLELLRSLTDEHVLRTLMEHRRLTRAELAAETGVSKPTAGESVRRLTEAGLVADTGERTAGGRGRGRVGSYYALAAPGAALALSIAPDGITAECVDAFGDTVSRAERPVGRPARPTQVAAALRDAAAAARAGSPAALRLAVVSAADPVDRVTGRLVHLPDAPFLLGDLDPAAVLAPYAGGPVTVDNDVNWAARAERDSAPPPAPRDFAYVYLGEGTGCAVVSDGEVRRGSAGLAGEIAHLVTTGPRGQAMRLIDVFGELGLRQDKSTAIDVARLLAAATAGQEVRRALAEAVSGVLAAVTALSDPQAVILGGPWGADPLILDAVTAAFARTPRPVPVRPARLLDRPSLAGARADALSRLRAAIVAGARQAAPGAGNSGAVSFSLSLAKRAVIKTAGFSRRRGDDRCGRSRRRAGRAAGPPGRWPRCCAPRRPPGAAARRAPRRRTPRGHRPRQAHPLPPARPGQAWTTCSTSPPGCGS